MDGEQIIIEFFSFCHPISFLNQIHSLTSFSPSSLSSSACLSCLKTRTGWCCPLGWSLRGSSSVPGPSDWTSWKGEKCWCRWTLAACWLLSTWGYARTREKPRMHTHLQIPAVSFNPHPHSVEDFYFCSHEIVCFLGIVSDSLFCPLLPIILVSPIK